MSEKVVSNKRHKTSKAGVFYRECLTNGNKDKTYYIRYRNEKGVLVEVKIGKHSENITIPYCYKKRIKILNSVNNNENSDMLIGRRRKKHQVLFREEYFKYIVNRVRNDNVILNARLEEIIKNHILNGSIPEDSKTRKKLYSKSLYDTINKYFKHIEPFLGDKDMNSITKEDIEEIKWKKQEEGLSNSTINNMLTHISTIFNFTIKNNDKFTKSNIALKVERFKNEKNMRERFLTLEEVKELIDETDRIGNINLILGVRILLETGVRKYSLLQMEYDDINFKDNSINLYDLKSEKENLDRGTYKPYLGSLQPKTIELIKKYRSSNQKLVPLPRTSFDRLINPVLNKLFNDKRTEEQKKNDNKYKVVIHTLRHTFGTMLIEKGVDIYTVQRLMNHKDINITMRYAKVSDSRKLESLKGLYD